MILGLALVATLQSTIFSTIRFGPASIDLMLIVVVCFALTRGHQAALGVGLLGGIALDCFSVAPFGTYALALSITAVLATFALGLGMEGVTLQTLVVALSTLLFRGVVILTLLMTGFTIAWDPILLEEALASAVLNALLAPFVGWTIHGINRRVNGGLKLETGW